MFKGIGHMTVSTFFNAEHNYKNKFYDKTTIKLFCHSHELHKLWLIASGKYSSLVFTYSEVIRIMYTYVDTYVPWALGTVRNKEISTNI